MEQYDALLEKHIEEATMESGRSQKQIVSDSKYYGLRYIYRMGMRDMYNHLKGDKKNDC